MLVLETKVTLGLDVRSTPGEHETLSCSSTASPILIPPPPPGSSLSLPFFKLIFWWVLELLSDFESTVLFFTASMDLEITVLWDVFLLGDSDCSTTKLDFLCSFFLVLSRLSCCDRCLLNFWSVSVLLDSVSIFFLISSVPENKQN